MLAQQDLFSEESPITESIEYRRIIESFQYLTLTRPDIQFAVNKLAQFVSSPKPLQYWVAMKKVLRYLSGTLTFGITLSAVTKFTLTGYCDADWGETSSIEEARLGY